MACDGGRFADVLRLSEELISLAAQRVEGHAWKPMTRGRRNNSAAAAILFTEVLQIHPDSILALTQGLTTASIGLRVVLGAIGLGRWSKQPLF
jgi:hypothetical protein